MTKRLVMLEDDELETILGWYAAAYDYERAGDEPEEEEELAARLRAARLSS